MLENRRTKRRAALLASAATALAGFAFGTAQHAVAQTVESPISEEPGELEQIVVTGSRIARRDLTSPSPVSVIGEEEFELSGTNNTEELLNTLPQVLPGFTGRSNNPGNGTATIDLRNLGTNRTLVLQNGKRIVGSTTSLIVDINTIPAGLIERVEVVTGGASAVYGSDAIAGVVNFILKDDFEGLETSANFSVTSRGDGDVWDVDVLGGGNFADDRGNATFYFNYLSRDPILQADRGFSDTVEFTEAIFGPGGSSRVPEGRLSDPNFQSPTGGGTIFFTEEGAFGPAGDPFNYAPDNFFQLPQERFVIATSGRYEIVEDLVELYANMNYSNNQVPQQLAPTPLNLDNPQLPLMVDVDSPFFDDTTDVDPGTPGVQTTRGLLQAADTDGDGFVGFADFRRRMVENGPRQVLNERNQFRFVGGLRGDLPFNWQYDAHYMIGRTQLAETLENDISNTRFRAALMTEPVPGAPGQIQCADDVQRIQFGCVPINPFGEGNISQEAADFVSITAAQINIIEQEVYNVTLSNSDLFDFGAGPIGVAAGFEYREEEVSFNPDDPFQRGDVLGFNAINPTQGRFDVYEIFGEAIVPLLADLPFVEELEVNGAFRYSDYSYDQVGGVFTFTGGATYIPVSDLTLRGQFSRAIRAPNISEAFDGGGQGFPGAADPCSTEGAGTGPTGALADLCVDNGVPASAIGTDIQPDSQIEAFFVGNPDLQEETADTYTAGAVFTPRWVPGLNLTVDYFNVQIEDAISFLAAQVILDGCFDPGNVNQEFCDRIERAPNTGNISQINIPSANLGEIKTSGVDISTDYSMDVPIGIGGAGSLSAFWLGTFYFNNETKPTPDAEFIECIGLAGTTCGLPQPEFSFTSRVTYRTGPVSASLRWRFQGAVDNDLTEFGAFGLDPEFWQENLDPEFVEMEEEHYLDFTLTYQATDYLLVSATVENLTDNQPPLAGFIADGGNTFPDFYETLGTRFIFGAKATF